MHGKSSATTTLKWKSSMIDTTSFIRFHQETLLYQVPWAMNICKFMNIYDYFTIFNPKPDIPFPPKSDRLTVDSCWPFPPKTARAAKGAAASGRTSNRRKIWRWEGGGPFKDAKWFLYLAEYGSWQPEILRSPFTVLRSWVVEIPMILRRVFGIWLHHPRWGFRPDLFHQQYHHFLTCFTNSTKKSMKCFKSQFFLFGVGGRGIPMFDCCNLLEDIFGQTAHTILAIILYWYQ